MRNDFSAQVETAEIADSELDNIAGGVATLGGSVAGYSAGVSVEGTAVDAVEGLAQGTIAKATGLAAATGV
ncbi:hypothetical protein [Streptomyces purpurogeneiscleroticus]|uniref:hypothetical protein n=1 Tax=Streptomyces purpurogeneiscleroticus TaxID=68259 RepID=UPI001CC1423C|nr:hypothetical protein [Streptomyces purpurogeneiscleroticus]MBZ4015192.1 hypothetical protein [Streptomyces purpurogeneiscleroticus]